MTSKAFIRSVSKSTTGTEDGLLIGKGSFLVSFTGEWLLLLLSLWYLLSPVFANSWDLLIPGVSFLLLTSQSISWSSTVNGDDEELDLWLDNLIIFWLGERIGDFTGDFTPPLAARLDWLTRWWSHTTNSRIYASVFSLSAWYSVSIRRSTGLSGFLFMSDLQMKKEFN